MQHPVSPSLRKQALQGRAQQYRQIREFFFEKGVLEVETPIFSQAGNTDPSIQSLTANFCASDSEPWVRYAQTSPEFAMKRLLAEGVGPIFQICKVFRLEERGRLHNPEFSMLEWYRPGLSYFQLMDEIEELLQALGLDGACSRLSYQALFEKYLGFDVLSASMSQLKNCAQQHQLDVVGELNSFDDWCHLLLSHLIEPELKRTGAVFIYDYPASQAALARIRPDNKAVAERFELYIDGVEIANGYQELTHSPEYRRRFLAENRQRYQQGLVEIPLDENLLQAMTANFPACSGVAMGLDRLLMYCLGMTHIQEVISFDFVHA